MKLTFKGKHLFEKSGAENIHKFSLLARLSAQTAYKYLSHGDDIKAVDLGVLLSILSDGMGLSRDEILELPLGEILDLVDD